MINAAVWLLLHMGVAWLGTQLPADWFRPYAWLFRVRNIEKEGAVYQQFFRVKCWKDLLPDGASWFQRGFPKGSMSAADTGYLQRFLVETCRGEAVHWVVFGCTGLFFLWNTAGVGWVMLAYAACANLPCIAVQRYNRARLAGLLGRQKSRSAR